MALFGSPKLRIFAEGDSITGSTYVGSGSHDASLYPTATGDSRIIATNLAYSGSSAASLGVRASIDNAYLPAPNLYMSVMFGHNDLVIYRNGGDNSATAISTFLGIYATQLDNVRAAGWKVLLMPITPSTAYSSGDAGFNSFNTDRATCNTTFATWVGTHCDAYLSSLEATTMWLNASASDTLLYGDGTHPTSLGQATIAPAYLTAISPYIT